ncbi:ATP F0F1 synthase subunit delta, partial [Campylobacter jejuni]
RKKNNIDIKVKNNKKVDTNIKKNNKISQDDSVKIELEELGYELSFSMKALQNKLNEYILKII